MENLTLDDLNNIRFALNEKIHALVMACTKEGGNLSTLSQATKYAETRDKVQAEIESRQANPQADQPSK